MEVYKVGSFTKGIETVTALRATEKTVWIGNRRCARKSHYEKYFDTYEQAKAYLLDQAKMKLERAKDNLERSEENLKYVQSL